MLTNRARGALCAATAALVLAGVGWQRDWERIDAEAVALPALVELTLPDVPRCPYCGRIESKREIAPFAGGEHGRQSFDYTVRMRDGSSRVFREELPVSWRLGERLVFIEGAEQLPR